MQNATAFIAAMKESWLSNTIENSVFVGSPVLDEFAKLTPTAEHGDEVLVAVRTGLSGGFSAVPRDGSSELNEGTNVVTKQAKYNYSHNWFDVIIESAVIDESASSALAVAKAVEVEREGAVDGIKRQLQRGLFSNGSGIICSLADNTNTSTTMEVDDAGKEALKRGHLYAGLKIDIGTKAEESSKVAGREITAVSVANGTITISGEKIDTEEAGKFFVSIANARSGETSYEIDGLGAMVSATTTYGGIEPSAVPTWAAYVDSAAQDVSPSLLYSLEDEIFQSSGEEPDWCISSAKQVRNLLEVLVPQIRYNGGDSGASTGQSRKGLTTPEGTRIERHFDCPDSDMYMLRKRDLGSVRSKQGPQWASPEMIRHQEGTTRFRGDLVWRLNTALLRRNTHGVANNLN